MQEVPERIVFPKEEEAVLHLWDKIKAFETSLKLSEGKPEYSFYDGPPFATGLPHYGHILAGTIKDVVTRYAHNTGHHVTRRFGWDCHGLPIEFEIDKIHGVKTRDDVLAMGIPKYNAECRAIVMRYSEEWKTVVKRLGRWIDMENNYKTMDLSFMESVWWVFSQLEEKGLVYQDFKVMPYSTGCSTPLSNFEANLLYKDVTDPAVYVSFPLIGEDNVSMIAWTTTPWTLPSNLALCVNPDLEYAHIHDIAKKKDFILLVDRIPDLYKHADKDIQIKAKFKGSTLAGKKYTPLFPYFESEKDAFVVLTDNYVTSEGGTGIVHQAPAFGEDDYRVCLKAGVIKKGFSIVCPVDANGRFTSDVTDFKGMYIKDADKEIIKALKQKDRLVLHTNYPHSYPFCWRSETPLIYKAVPSWFVAVEKIRDKLVQNNKESLWVPDFVQEKRFHNWLENARDWAVSRNRYWGTPLPIWMDEERTEKVFVRSVAHLEELSGVKVTDIHRESIDHITITSKTSGKVLRRVEEVFDCWFESGSMPYAQLHYPFENKELFEKTFPADFVAEGIDQTRGWFYTLLVLGTALFGKTPYKNLIVNGLVLAADGKKMSKRLKNYPDPVHVINEYGADSLRLYLINSPVVRADTLKFNEKGVRDVIKDVFLPWFNAYRFFVQNALRHSKSGHFVYNADVSLTSDNVMDKWILAACHSLILFVRQEMKAYRLYTVVPKLVFFIGQLTNWYVRLNRRRLKGAQGEKDSQVALNILFEVLFNLGKTMAPFTPFFTEYVYQNLKLVLPENQRKDSLHFEDFPEARQEALNPRIEEAVARMQEVIELGRAARDRRKLPVKTPLRDFMVVQKDAQYLQDLEGLKPYILEELNMRTLTLTSNEGSFVNIRGEPDRKRLGERCKKDMGKVAKAVQEMSHEQLRTFQSSGKVTLEGHELTHEDIKIIREFSGDKGQFEAAWSENVLTILDCKIDEELKSEGLAREVVNRLQKLKKKAGLQPSDPIEVFYLASENSALEKAIVSKHDYIRDVTKIDVVPAKHRNLLSAALAHEVADVEGTRLDLWIVNCAFSFNEDAITKRFGAEYEDVKTAVLTLDYFRLKNLFKDNKYSFTLNDKQVELELGKDIFLSAAEKLKHLKL